MSNPSNNMLNKLTKVPSTTMVVSEIKEEEQSMTTVQNPLFKPRVTLAEMLLGSDYELLSALGEVVLIPEEGRLFAESLIDFFTAHNRCGQLMEWAIAKEINTNSSSSTLFRGACEATKLMPVIYARLGTEYLRQVVGPLVKDITSSSQSFEIDPHKAEKGVDVKDNLKKVLSITNEFLQHIYTSIEQCPAFLRHIFYLAKREVTKKFPQASSIIVGVFFFLRFMFPSIVSPDRYGLVLEPPSSEAQRGLILISKLLQNLTNGNAFDDSDEFSADMNRFIAEKSDSLYSFFNRLADKKAFQEPPFQVSGEAEAIAMTVISHAMRDHKDKVFPLLVKSETKKVYLQFLDSMEAHPLPLSNISGVDDKRWSIIITPKKKKLEKLQKLSQEEKVARIEEMLDDEMKSRRALEKTVSKLESKLKDQQRKYENRIQELENRLNWLFSTLQISHNNSTTTTTETLDDQIERNNNNNSQVASFL